MDINGLSEDAAGNEVFPASTPPEKRLARDELSVPAPTKQRVSYTGISVGVALVVGCAILFSATMPGSPASGVTTRGQGGMAAWKERAVVVDDDQAGDDDEMDLDAGELNAEELALLAGTVSADIYVPPLEAQDEIIFLNKMCKLWMDYDKEVCSKRSDAVKDMQKINTRMLRLGLHEDQIKVYTDEHVDRMRSTYDEPSGQILFEKSSRGNCLSMKDAKSLGLLVAAMAEDMMPSKSGKIKKNKKGYERSSFKCCHRVCRSVYDLGVGGNFMYEACCSAAPSKCATYYEAGAF